jgi:transposase
MQEAQMSYSFFVGIDLSKAYFDASIVNESGKKLAYKRFKNLNEGYFLFLNWVDKTTKNSRDILFCMEYTGIYGRLLQHFLQDHQLALWLESGLQIKRSQGIQRGKNDKVDSFRIAVYAQEKGNKANICPDYDSNLEQMHDLLTTRNRLLKTYNALKTAQKELKEFDPSSYQMVKKVQKPALDGLKLSLKEVEKAIDALVEKNPAWHKNLELATSVKGIGKTIGLWLLVYTRNFDPRFNARKLAAFVGVAPYQHSSGSSIDKGTHTSSLAHISLKTLLHMATMSAISYNPFIKKYYNRKKAEGKKGLLVMNNVKNKLIHTMMAVIRSQNPFDPQFQHQKMAA